MRHTFREKRHQPLERGLVPSRNPRLKRYHLRVILKVYPRMSQARIAGNDYKSPVIRAHVIWCRYGKRHCATYAGELLPAGREMWATGNLHRPIKNFRLLQLTRLPRYLRIPLAPVRPFIRNTRRRALPNVQDAEVIRA